MAKGKIFEYAVVYHPPTKEKTDEAAKRSLMIVDVKRVLAATEQEAVMLAARDIPVEYTDRLDAVEIVVRPF